MSEPELAMRKALQERWIGQEERVARILDALREGKDWTKWLAAFTSHHRIFQALPFVDQVPNGKDLRGIRLDGVNLASATLAGANLSFAQLFRVILDNACVSTEEVPSSLAYITALHCSSKGADLSAANCQHAHFGHCDFSTASFAGSTLDGATLRSSQFNECDFSHASFKDVQFAHSNMPQIGVSADTIFAVTDEQSDPQSVPLILLEKEAVANSFDRFQFASSEEAFRHAAQVYSEISLAFETAHLSRQSSFWRERQIECSQKATLARALHK